MHFTQNSVLASNLITHLDFQRDYTFPKNLLTWFETHCRQLPWRETEDPYRIWVSEVMLQQTQVKKVLEYYEKFVSRFPDVESLAGAALQELLKTWEGLGYYARARNLHKAAQIVVEDMAGEIPVDYATFRQLPGVGTTSPPRCRALRLMRLMLL